MFITFRHRSVSATLIVSLLVAVRLFAGGSAENTPGTAINGQELIRETVERLAAPDLAGRLTGSAGNQDAAEFLAGELGALGLEPLPGSNSMMQSYSQPVLRRGAPARLIVHGHGSESIELAPGKDFHILIRHGATIGGSVEATVVAPPEHVNTGWIVAHRENALLLDAETFAGISQSRELMSTLFSREDGPAAVLLGMPPEVGEVRRGVFLTHPDYPAGGPMLVQTTAEITEQLHALREPRVEIASSYRVEAADVANIAAQVPVPGATGPPILLTAHFDGQGSAGDNIYYPGAVDNASGVATVLETARLLAERVSAERDRSSGGQARRRPIWVVLFNGEEQGLYGSRAFAQTHGSVLDGALIVNIDMIGHSEHAAFSVVKNGAGGAVAADVADRLEEAGFTANHGGQGRSDHLSFDGVAPAVTVVQAPYPHMHAQGDTPARLDAAVLQRAAEAIAAYVDEATRAGKDS